MQADKLQHDKGKKESISWVLSTSHVGTNVIGGIEKG